MGDSSEWTVVGGKGSKRKGGKQKSLSLKAAQALSAAQEGGGTCCDGDHFTFDAKTEPLNLKKVASVESKVETAVAALRQTRIYHELSAELDRHGCLPQKAPPSGAGNGCWMWAASGVAELVMYGLGSPANSKVSQAQLALADLLMVEYGLASVAAAGRAWTYDPVLEASDLEVLHRRGWQALKTNENGARVAGENGPGGSLFYMPHCEAVLYDNLLRANWTRQKLPRLAILGNSFQMYVDRWDFKARDAIGRPHFILAVIKYTSEIVLGNADAGELQGFNDMSFHTFAEPTLPEMSDPFWNANIIIGDYQ